MEEATAKRREFEEPDMTGVPKKKKKVLDIADDDTGEDELGEFSCSDDEDAGSDGGDDSDGSESDS